MKKFFYLVALVATVAFTACGKSEQKLSADDEAALQALANIIDEEIRQEADSDEEIVFKSTTLEGRDIVITAVVDESDLPGGMTIKTAFQLSGQNMDMLADQIAQEFLGDAPEEAKPLLEVLHRCNSALVLRYEGNLSHETVDLRIPSEKIPE